MNFTKSKLVMGIAAAAVTIGFALTPVMASADTASDLQTQINSLLSTIQSLQAQLAATTGGSSSMMTGYTFNSNLTVGSTGTDVMNLQKVLNMSADTQVSTGSSAGAPGYETSTFGPATKAAVIKFQMKYGITPAVGYVGAITRAKLNSMNAGSSTTGTTGTTGTTPVVGGSLVFGGATQPANSLAPQGASRVPFTTFTLTNTGTTVATVNGVTVQRTGLANDSVFTGVVLVDSNNIQIGTSKTFNSNHQATVGDIFTLNPGETKTLTVAGNMQASEAAYAGQVVSISVVGVNSTATVAGSFPVTGAAQTINGSLTIGSVTVNTSSFDPLSAQSRNIGDTGVRFTGIRFTANSAEDLKLFSLRWRQVGTASTADFSNVTTIVNGTSYPTTVSADGKYYTAVFPGGILIPKGNSVDAYIQGDITGTNAASRTVIFDLDKLTDVYFVGQTYGYGIAPANTTSGTNNNNLTGDSAWWSGYTTTINGGQATTIGKANAVAAQNIAVNVPNQVLGGFTTNFIGEPVSVQSMYFEISTTSTLTNTANSPFAQITSVSIVDQNGNVVAGPVDASLGDGSLHGTVTSNTSAYSLLHFTDTVTFPTGMHTYTLKGKIPSSFSNGTTVNLFTSPVNDWTSITGSNSGNTISLTGLGQFSMNQMTVKAANLAVTVSTQPTSQNIVAGAQNLVLANFQLDASQSGEDLRISSLPIDISGNVGDLSGCQIWNGSTALNTTVVNSLTTQVAKVISFQNSLTIPKGTIVTLSLTCNVASNASGSNSYQEFSPNTIGNSSYTVTGVTSGNSVTTTAGSLTLGSGVGGVMTVQSGSLAMSVDPSSPSYTVVAGGQTGVTVGVIKLRATNEGVNINKLGLQLTTGSSTDVTNAYLYNGATLLGTATFTGSNTTATSTFSSPLALLPNVDTLITIKADLADIGYAQSGTEGKLVKIDPANIQGTGMSSGSTVNASSTAGTNVSGVRVFNSYPTLALGTLGSTGIGDGKLMHFTVTANAAGPVGISQMKFTIATTTLSFTNVGLYAYNDAGFSNAISGQGTSGQIGNLFGVVATGVSAIGTTVNGVSTITVTPTTNPIEISAGSTLYFELRGSVSGNASAAAAITTLSGDSAYPTTIDGTHGYFVATSTNLTNTTNNFVWSGNATSTSATSDVDWSNGYGLPGFPSSGLIQSRSF